MSIDASLVLLHYNQSNCLRKTILALEQQKTDKTFEVIIADDGSNFKNLLEVENIIKTSSLPIQLVWQQDLGFRAAKARNNGIMLSRSDLVILAFTLSYSSYVFFQFGCFACTNPMQRCLYLKIRT